MTNFPPHMKASEHQLQVPGLRMTKQRKEVYRALMDNTDHPTASQLFDNLKDSEESMSLATVYNCLEALVEHGAIKQVNVDRQPTRYCQNSAQHGHFHDQSTGTIHDINFKQGVNLIEILNLPAGTEITNLEITLKGTLPT